MLEIFAALGYRKQTSKYSLKHFRKPNVGKLESTNTKLTHGHLHSHINHLFFCLSVTTKIESFHVKNCAINYIFFQ